MYFGFDTTSAAEAAKQRLTEANFGALAWDVDHENRCIGEALREAERASEEASYTEAGKEVDWKNDPRFAERSTH
jgi:hypothetical protein